MRPILSVIIPAYNEERYIDACLSSLLKQKITVPYEIIVVDNNSTDETAAKASAYRRVRLIRETYPGASSARNSGARAARGDILVFLDADCIAPPEHLARVHRILSQTSSVDGVAGPYIYYDAGSFIQWLTGQGKYFIRYYQLMKFLFGFQGFAGGNVALRQSVYRKSGGYNKNISVLEADDVEYAKRLNKKGYHVKYTDRIRIRSSFRRIQKNPIRTPILRTLYAFRYLT